MLVQKANTGGEFLCIYDDDVLVGMVYMVTDAKVAYVFYFAVDEKFRGKGYGKATMGLLLEKYKDKRFFLALEDVNEASARNTDERIRRHIFYEHCGLVDLPGKIKEGPVTFAIMGNGGSVSPDEYENVITGWCGNFYRKLFGMCLVAEPNDL